MSTANDRLLELRLRRAGAVHPVFTLQAARSAGLNLALGLSLLVQESSGGHNEYGHDPTIFVGAGAVTEANYQLYRAERIHSGNRLCQGVGPGQLTYWGFQDAADRMGGCWRPDVNIRFSFAHLAELIRRAGLTAGVTAYNGSGPAADRYAQAVILRARMLAGKLKTPAP